jgi:uncharacterized protein (DUF1778 family)
MASDKVSMIVRVTRAERERIAAAARRLGITRNDFIRLRALAAAEEASEIERIEAVVAGLEASLAEALDAHAERVNGNLKNVADWMKRRWPEPAATQ